MNKEGVIQAILFINGKEGCSASELRKITNIDNTELTSIISSLNTKFKEDENSPYIINCYSSVYYLLTKPELKEIIEKLNIVQKNKNPLSKTLLEVLSIIAYNPNCTSSIISQIRDADPSNSLDRLTKLGLIKNEGRSKLPGAPYTYSVTEKFYNLTGIKSAGALPKIETDFNIDEDVDFFNSNHTFSKKNKITPIVNKNKNETDKQTDTNSNIELENKDVVNDEQIQTSSDINNNVIETVEEKKEKDDTFTSIDDVELSDPTK